MPRTMTESERREIVRLIEARIAATVEDDARAARADADIDLSDFCVGGKLDRTEAQMRIEAARNAAGRRRAAFGTCAVCGGDIPVKRLRVQPAATHCAGCR
jgi:RNA polymerase-binding transcription factor DksA